MDRLLDYGDLGALVRAGFSSSDPPSTSTSSSSIASKPCSSASSSPFSVSAIPASDSCFPGFHSPSFQLPSLSTAFDILSLPHLNYGAPPPTSGFSPSVDSAHAYGSSALLPSGFLPSLSAASFRNLDRVDSSGFVLPFTVAAPNIHSNMSVASSMGGMPVDHSHHIQQLRFDDRFLPRQPLSLSVLRQILAEEEDFAVPKSSTSGEHAPSQASETRSEQMRADKIFASSTNFSRSFLSPLIANQELPATSTSSASAGAEKRAAETELSSSATVNNPNKATGAKRSRKLLQKKVVHIPALGGVSSKPSAGENVPSDMWAWRKYGQKPIKGSPYPRGYYRCSSSKGCPARKQVERNPNDPSMLVVTYTSDHNHAWPTHRINALAGSTRPPLAKSPSLSGTNALSPNCDTSNSPLSVDMDDGPSASPLSLDDTLLDDDLIMCRDLDATNFNATSPAFSITSAPLVTYNATNPAKPAASLGCEVVKSDSDTTNPGHTSSTFSTSPAPSMIHNVANAGASTDLSSLHTAFRVCNTDLTANSSAAVSTFSTTSASRTVHSGSGVGVIMSGFTASSSQAFPLVCDAGFPSAGESGCATNSTSYMAEDAAKPEACAATATWASTAGNNVNSAGATVGGGCVEEEALFDTLLSEMLEEVQWQNRANVEVMAEDEEGLLLNWSNNIHFLSQVNHLVQ